MSLDSVTPRVPRPSFGVLVSAIVAGALGLRLVELGSQPLWFDEAFSWHIASSQHFLAEIVRENSPPLYYLLLRALTAVVGDGEAGLRLLSALAGAAFVAGILLLARDLFGETVALCSGVLAAVAPYHLYYSQEARSYALLTALLAFAYWALERALRKDTLKAWGLFLLLVLLACATHVFAPLALAPCLVPVLAARDRRQLLRFLGVGFTAAVALGGWLAISAQYALRTPKAFEVLRKAWELDAAGARHPAQPGAVRPGRAGRQPSHLPQAAHLARLPLAPSSAGTLGRLGPRRPRLLVGSRHLAPAASSAPPQALALHDTAGPARSPLARLGRLPAGVPRRPL
ncbi:MAG: glycosyltransferase family 39 protein [Myxococcales bacterium]